MAFLVNQRPCYQNLEQNLKPRSTLKKCIFKTKVSRVSLGADISFGIPFISLLSDWPRWLHLWPVFRAISKEKCKSNQHVCLSFISVIPELDPDSIGSNERYMLILFSLFFFFLSRQWRATCIFGTHICEKEKEPVSRLEARGEWG